jgi:hypothetical protein
VESLSLLTPSKPMLLQYPPLTAFTGWLNLYEYRCKFTPWGLYTLAKLMSWPCAGPGGKLLASSDAQCPKLLSAARAGIAMAIIIAAITNATVSIIMMRFISSHLLSLSPKRKPACLSRKR